VIDIACVVIEVSCLPKIKEKNGTSFYPNLRRALVALCHSACLGKIRTLSASPAALFSSSYALRFENNSLRQVRIGGVEPAMTEQRVEFVVLIFSHGTLTR
jgi:hypothetical protein